LKSSAGAALVLLRVKSQRAPAGCPGSENNARISRLVRAGSLNPGTAYVFQARALTDSGFTDWSDPITRICT